MQRADIDGITLEYHVQGSGDPVVFIHGGVIGDTYRPLATEPVLRDFRLIRYNRRGYAGSSRPDGGLPVAGHAADCLALIRNLDASPAHVVGHSSGGAIALQLALDAPEAVRSLTLLEPALLGVPSGAKMFEELGPAIQKYQGGDKAGAVDGFMQTVCGKTYRGSVEAALRGALDQAVNDADDFFGGELPAVGGWTFTREDAARIQQPVLAVMGANSDAVISAPMYSEIQARLLEWFPQAKPFVLPRAAHLLHIQNPTDMAERLAAFLKSN
jgi:pimeloyl-ACP methyl ester carboxylesterase